MSPLTIIFTIVIAVCVVVTVLINGVTSRYSRLRECQKRLDALSKVRAKDRKPDEDAETSTDSYEEAKNDYDKALEAYHGVFDRFYWRVTAGVLGLKRVDSAKETE